MDILFFKPIPRPALWGHTLIKDYFKYDDFPDGIGQSWAFSAQDNASTICMSQPYEGMTLKDLWANHQELFGHPNEKFPVIISLVAPEDDLSIQVHPDEDHARKKGYTSGKNEAWYFIKAKENADIVYGHNAKDEKDLKNYIKEEKWDELIKHLKVHTGDFVYLPAGLLHALKKGSIVYEIQQSTDITYRFFDYHRKDKNGQERELHLNDAIECLSYNPENMKNNINPITKLYDGIEETIFISNESFTVTKLKIRGDGSYCHDNYQLATIVDGNGIINSHQVILGDSFLIPKGLEIKVSGNMTIMMTTK